MSGQNAQQKHIVLFINNGQEEHKFSDTRELEYLTLPHPKGSIPIVYLYLENEFYELQTAAPRKHASWFLNQRVNSDKHFYLASRIDPRFLILPYLEKSGSKFSPLDQIVTNAPGCQRIPLTNAQTKWHLEEMCDVKDLGDMVFYRYNEEKAMQWLSSKLERTARILAKQRKQRLSREQSLCVSGFDAGTGTKQQIVESEGSDDVIVGAEDKRIAVQIIIDYLTESMSAKLLSLAGFAASDMQASRKQETKRKADWELDLELEAESLAYAMPAAVSNITSTAKKAPTSKPNAASKFNGGKPVEAKKSIASFFGPKA